MNKGHLRGFQPTKCPLRLIVEGDAEKISEIAAFMIGKRSCKFMQIKGNFNIQDIHVVVDCVRNMQVKA